MLYRLAIFDFDGTLADSFPFFVEVFNRLADRHGFARVDGEQIEAMRHERVTNLIRKSGLSAFKQLRVASDFRGMMRRANGIRPFAGVPDMLGQLHGRGVRLGLLSSNARDNIERVLGLETFRLFEEVECGMSLLGKGPRMRAMLRRAGVAPADAIYIGDSDSDGDAARSVGVAFGAVSWGFAALPTLRRCEPAHEFGSVDEIVLVVSGR